MSKNQARITRQTMIPVLNHPRGRKLCSLYKALLVEKDGRGVIYEGVLHWYNYQPDPERGYYGPTKGEYRIRESIERDERSLFGFGMLVKQLEQV